MDVKLTPEVTAAHKNLRDPCERFENAVDELCASSLQSIPPHEFYESECVPIAVECVDALSTFESARSYEVTAYERTIAKADDILRQQKRELEKNAAQRAKVYESEIAEAGNILRQQKRKLEENAAQSIKTCENAIAEADDERGFEALPPNKLDRSDRKFLATAVVGEARILNATDSDWAEQQELTGGLGVDVVQLCPEHATKAGV